MKLTVKANPANQFRRIPIEMREVATTADVAGGKVGEARKRLAAALESGQEMYARVREKAVAGVKTGDAAVHEHPYQVIGLAFGVGALIGNLAARRHCRSDD